MQPAVHRLAACVRAPSATLSSHDGDVCGEGAHGFYLGDRRLLSRFVLRVGGRPLEVVGHEQTDPATLVVRAVVRDGSEPSPDPRLLLTRTRRQHDAGFVEVIELSSWDLVPRTVPLRVEAACDLARTDEVKDGRTVPRTVDRGTSGSGLRFAGDGYAVEVTSGDGPVVDVGAGSLTWEVSVEPHATHRLTISVSAVRPRDGRFRPLVPPAGAPAWAVEVTTDDPRVDRFVRWGRDDLEHLLLADPEAPDRRVRRGRVAVVLHAVRARLAVDGADDAAVRHRAWRCRRCACSPDAKACITTRPPTSNRVASSTRCARRRSTRSPPNCRRCTTARSTRRNCGCSCWRSRGAGVRRPSRWRRSLPALERAAAWLLADADADGDGLCEYRSGSGHGLSNQGWKDSGDSVGWQHGPPAEGPIALCEVQAYTYEAALGAADLLERFGRGGAAELRAFATRLREAFHAAFWVDDDDGRYLAIGLDGDKRAITGRSSNPGHTIGTGLLDAGDEREVADGLVAALATPAGLRTLSADSRRFNPLSYHNGSVWPHDTAICARGMVLAGLTEHAATLLGGLVGATDTFGPRLPELYAVLPDGPTVPYPAACRPQAWAAAAAGVVAWALAPAVPSPDRRGLTPLAPVPIAGARRAPRHPPRRRPLTGRGSTAHASWWSASSEGGPRYDRTPCPCPCAALSCATGIHGSTCRRRCRPGRWRGWSATCCRRWCSPCRATPARTPTRSRSGCCSSARRSCGPPSWLEWPWCRAAAAPGTSLATTACGSARSTCSERRSACSRNSCSCRSCTCRSRRSGTRRSTGTSCPRTPRTSPTGRTGSRWCC